MEFEGVIKPGSMFDNRGRKSRYLPDIQRIEKLLYAVKDDKPFTIPAFESWCVTGFLLWFVDIPHIVIEDTIEFTVYGRDTQYFYCVYAEPHLSMFMKGAVSLKIDNLIPIDSLVSVRIVYPKKFILYLMGQKIITK